MRENSQRVNKMKVICLLSSLSQPRCIKRVNALVDAGFDVEVYGYLRKYYDVNTMSYKVSIVTWGVISNGVNYFKRIKDIAYNIKKILRENKNRRDILYYAFGFDFSLILSFLRPHSYIYESSDLIYANYKSKIIVSIFKTIDKLIIKKSYKTILTSEGFRDYLYGAEYPENIIVHPNKVNSCFRDFKRENKEYGSENKKLTFAYVGAFRYPNTVFRFARVIGEKFPDYSFYFYGDSEYTYLAKELSEKYDNVKFFGKFRNPEDLEAIYSNVDILAVCYDTSTLNERIAEPNKLYEAICFCKPIVVSKGTFLEKKIKTLGIGFAIDAADDVSITAFLKSIDTETLNIIGKKEKEMDVDSYVDSSEFLIDAVDSFLS